jgi:hypothetical protein
MEKIKNILKLHLKGYKLHKNEPCSCGCNTCNIKSKPISLNENLASVKILSEGLKHHINNKKPLTESIYRTGSKKYFDLWAEARNLYSRGILEITNSNDVEILTETNLGEFGLYNNNTVPLDFPMLEESLNGTLMYSPFSEYEGWIIQYVDEDSPSVRKYINLDDSDISWAEQNKKDIQNRYGVDVDFNLVAGKGKLSRKPLMEDKKKNPPLNKPHRGGSKKFYVYVRDPKTKKIKKVSFGMAGGKLRAKLNNPKARKAFAKRQRCAQAKDRTTARYWSCHLPRYAKLLGFNSTFSGYW